MLSVKELKELQRNAKARRTTGLFIAEGIKMLREAPKTHVEQICVSASFMEEHEDLVLAKVPSARDVMVLPDSRFESLSDTRTPQGVLVVVRAKRWTAADILKKERPFVIFLENVQDPGNAGTILRTAEAAGADGVFLTEGSVDIHNPKTIRSTMGAVYRVPHVTVRDVPELFDIFRALGVTTYGAAPGAKTSYLDGDYRSGCAFLIGNESRGLGRECLEACACPIFIPMKGRVESLNAAMAAGILMYEAARQRGA